MLLVHMRTKKTQIQFKIRKSKGSDLVLNLETPKNIVISRMNLKEVGEIIFQFNPIFIYPDSQWYPYKLCLIFCFSTFCMIKIKLDIYVFVFETVYFYL